MATKKKFLKLTIAQEKIVDENINKISDIMELSLLVFGRKRLNCASEEVRAVKKYLKDQRDLQKRQRGEAVNDDESDPYFYPFTEQEEKLILEEAEDGASTVQIAKKIWTGQDDEFYRPLGKHCRYVLYCLKKNNVDPKTVKNGGVLYEYKPPKTMIQALRLVEEATGIVVLEDRMKKREAIAIEKMIRNMNSIRFVRVIDGYSDAADKELFKQEFVRQTWDKDDLTPEEVNLYILLCKNITRLETVSSQQNKIDLLIESLDEDAEFSKNLSESIKSLDSAYKDCFKSIQDLTTKLQGNRAERLKLRTKENATILNIVEAWKDEKTRAEMIKLSERRANTVSQEVDEFTAMDEFSARILGLRRDDVI